MSFKERCFHALLFEILVIIFSVIGLSVFTNHGAGELSGTMVAVCTIATVWNLVFNRVFDMWFTAPREQRGVLMRIMHTLLFEGGLLFITTPVIAWILSVSLWQALVMDIGVTLFVTVYTFFFNWIYDNVRLYFVHYSLNRPV